MSVTRERSAGSVTAPVSDDADQLRALVSAMLSGAYKEEFYLWDVASLCRAKPEFSRQLLALIDRYYRLGQMPAAQHRKIKEKIEHTVAAYTSPAPTERASGLPPDTSIGALTRTPSALSAGAASSASAALPPPRRPPVDATVTAPLPLLGPAEPSATGATTIAAAAPAQAVDATATTLSAAAQVAALIAAESAAAVTIGPGTVLRNRYELQALLGYGGMGSVYKALDRYRASLGLPDCCVALKIASGPPSGSGNLMASGREFHNAQQLSHPNVINVYEIDHEGETCFFTMELLEGERLSQLLQRIGGPLPRRHALTIIRDIGAALAHAHSRAVIHSDVKPHNIFITYGGQVRVLDFGGLSVAPREPWIGELTPGNGRGSSTADNYRTATPAYASCEQLEGRRADLRDDIYALACVAYELLAGQHPFNGKSSLEARAQHLRPKRPAAMRAECWRALRRGLAWHREQRPGQIEPWLEQLGVAAAAERLPPSHQLSAIQPARPWRRRGSLAALLLLGLAGTVFGIEHQGGIDWRGTLLTGQATLQSAWRELQSGTSTAVTDPAPSIAPATQSPRTTEGAEAASVPEAPPDTARSGSAQRAATAASSTPLAQASGSTAESDSATRTQPIVAAAAASNAMAPAALPDAAVTSSGVRFASLSYDVGNTAPAARLVIRRTGGSLNDVRFVWWTEPASAKANVDYAPLGRHTERIPSGEDNITIYVPIISNPLRHESSQFYVALGAPETDPNAAPGSAGAAVPSERATVTIERGGQQ